MVTLLLALGCAPDGGSDAKDPHESGDSSPPDTADTTNDSADTGETAEESGDDTAPDSDTGGDSDTAPADHDADDDGHDAPEYDGDDCDDTNPSVYPGAEEWCDPVDHDCDGETLAPGVCGKGQDPAAVGRPLLSYSYPGEGLTDVRVMADLNGDAFGEIYVSCWGPCGTEYRSYQVLPGGVPSTALTLPEDNLETWALGGGAYGGEQAEPAGDVDGDGFEDIAYLVHDGGRGLYVDLGPFLLDGSVHEMMDVDVIYTSDLDGGSWGSPYVGGYDFDQDGRSDFAVAAADGGDDEVAMDLFFGGISEGEYTRLHGRRATPLPIGDLDGDGVEDLLAENAGGDWAWLSGASLRADDGAVVDDVVEGSFVTYRPDEAMPRLGSHWANLGDWDGDGHPELAVVSPWSNAKWDPTHEILFFGGNLTGYHDSSDAVGVLDGGEGCDRSNSCGWELTAVDFDGDGILDVATDGYREEDGGYLVFLFPGSRGIPSPGAELDASLLRWSAVGGVFSSGDLDHSGYGDVIGEFSGLGTVRANLGWEVPWDDPTYW